MRRIWINLGALAILLIGGWFLLNQKQIQSVDDALRLASSQWKSLNFRLASQASPQRAALRVASFNIQAFGPEKAKDANVMKYLAQIAREFDVVAIQELRGNDDLVLRTFVDTVNAEGRNYALVASEPIGRNRYFERYAFLFDRDTVILDGSHSYTVQDPDDVLHREPFVGWFRSATVESDQAFTFSLVNVHLDSRQPDREVAYLAQLFRAIRSDGRGEDDVLIAGDFNAGPEQLRQLQNHAGLTCLITNSPTNVRFTQQYDNLLVDPLASTEFTGRSGVYDFLKVFNLTIDQATTISDHLPVWADFSPREGFNGNLTASRPTRNVK